MTETKPPLPEASAQAPAPVKDGKPGATAKRPAQDGELLAGALRGQWAVAGKTPPSKGEELDDEALAAVTGGQSVAHHRT